MPAHDSHHFVPAFILREWQTSPDSKLSAFHWTHGRLVHKRYKAKSVAKEVGLYALSDQRGGRHNVLERDYFAREIDDPAARVHRRILFNGLQSLDATERFTWGRFVVAQMLRAPRMIAHLKKRGAMMFHQALAARPEDYIEANDDESNTATLLEWIARNAGALSSDNLSLISLPDIVDSDLLHNTLRRATWGTMKFGQRAPYDLLIGDHPLLYVGTMETTFLLAMPISPRMAFLAFNNVETRRRLEGLSTKQRIRDMNFTTVQSASAYVYGTDERQSAFIERHLRRT